MVFEKVWESSNIGIFVGEHTLESTLFDLERYNGLGHEEEFLLLKKGHVESWYDMNQWEKESVNGAEFFGNPDKFKTFVKTEEKIAEKTRKMTGEFDATNFNKLSDQELFKKFEQAVVTFKDAYGVFSVSQPQCLEGFGRKLLKELAQVDDSEEIFRKLSTPSKPSIMIREEIAFKEMFIAFLKGEKKWPLISKHLKEYIFIHSLEGLPPMNEESILEKFTKNKKSTQKLRQEIDERQTFYKNLGKKQERIVKENNLDGKLVEKFKVLQHIGNSRLDVRHFWTTIAGIMDYPFSEICRRRNVESKDLGNYLFNEIKKLVLEGKKVNANELNARHEYSIVLIKDRKVFLLVGEKAKKFFKKNTAGEIIADFVEGMVANRGIVEGIVKVISPKQDLEKEMAKMEKGQVLVVNQTRPNLMPVIGKAKAIVTDEGGITCHAAIVSREFDIPCIVGTKKATSVFKDGDKILVDAEKGIAKKIE